MILFEQFVEAILQVRIVQPLPAREHRHRYTLAIAFSMAESAAPALAPSGPPACAISGRPPPPFPPRASEATRTRSTALKREGRYLVTPTTTPPLPSGAVFATATTPDFTFSFPSSTSAFRSLFASPLTRSL